MGSKTKQMRDQEETIKSHIVDRHKAGMCDHNGGFIPREKRGRWGKGSHFRPRRDERKYRDGYRYCFGHD